MRLKGNDRANRQARILRRSMSLPETVLWQHLRRSALGFRVRRQYPAGRYILDFYCAPVRLAIEIDGGAHDFGDRPERDAARDRWLEAQGVQVVRLRARDVFENLEGVLIHLRDRIAAAAPSTTHAAVSGPPPPESPGED